MQRKEGDQEMEKGKGNKGRGEELKYVYVEPPTRNVNIMFYKHVLIKNMQYMLKSYLGIIVYTCNPS